MVNAEFRQAAVLLRNVRAAQADGATWAQLAPLLRVPDGKQAKREAHRLERALKPAAALMAGRKGIVRDGGPAAG